MSDSRIMANVKRHAALATALCLMLAASSSVQAQPFAVDTSNMVGFEVLTAEDGAMAAKNMVVVKYDGPIVSPMATNLRTIWDEIKLHPRFEKVVLRLNSSGSVDLDGMDVVEF